MARSAGAPELPLEGVSRLAQTKAIAGMTAPRLRVAQVEPRSSAERAGLRPGDVLVAADGLVLRDQIDFQAALASGDGGVALDVLRAGVPQRVTLPAGSPWGLGLAFAESVPSGIRECNNHCEFCFIRGVPPGLRPSLYVRDDDYRYSFLFGNFLTLTNLAAADWDRIGYQRLTPLFVSVHATDLAVRRRMLANPRAPDICDQLRRLGRLGIEVHAQVVLCPGINDGPVLDRTIADLSALAHVVRSVAVVPVGLSRYIRARNVRALTADEARQAVDQIGRWQRALRRRLGRRFVYASDELYLLAGRRLPSARAYDGYPQLQNGVGLVRRLLESWRRLRRQVPARVEPPRRVVWVTGRAATPALEAMARDLRGVAGLSVAVRSVENSLFGGAIGVSGLLAGRDVAAALAGEAADRIVVPRAMFGHTGARTLDEWTVEDLERALGCQVRSAGSAAELLGATTGPVGYP